MKIKGLTLEQIQSAANEAGHFKLDNVRSVGNYHFFVLRMASSTPGKPDHRPDDHTMRYRKRSFGRMMYGRGPEYGIAVCFHGFRAFMRACFDRNPNAIIRTAKAAYLGSEDFEKKWPAVGSQNVGSQMCPVQYHEMCDC